MISYYFRCECSHVFEKFRLGIARYEQWRVGNYSISCPECNSTKIKRYMPKGSGSFKSFTW